MQVVDFQISVLSISLSFGTKLVLPQIISPVRKKKWRLHRTRTELGFAILMTTISKNKHIVILYTDKNNEILRFIWLRLQSRKQMFASYLNLLHFHHVFRLVFQDYARAFQHASSPIFNNFSSKKRVNPWPWTSWVRSYVPQKDIIKCEILGLKIVFSSYIHENSCS